MGARRGRGLPKWASRSWQLLADGRPEMMIWRETGGFGGGPSQTAAPEQTKSGYEIAGHFGRCVARAGPARWGEGVPKGASCSWQLRAKGCPEMSFWREIGGFRGGPSQTAAPERTKSGDEIAGYSGGCVARTGAARSGGGCLEGLVVAGSCSQTAAAK